VNVKLRKLALAIRYQWSSASAAALVIPAESDNSRTDGNTTTENQAALIRPATALPNARQHLPRTETFHLVGRNEETSKPVELKNSHLVDAPNCHSSNARPAARDGRNKV
jgi:hypothetical protein